MRRGGRALGIAALWLAASGCTVDRTGTAPVEAGMRDAGPRDAARDVCPPEGCTFTIGDDTFEDFVSGSRGESVANLYVHARGTVQTVMRSDVDRDGFADLILGSSSDGVTSEVPSRIYFGAPGGPSTAAAPLDVPTLGAYGSALADLDSDGFADVVFANHGGTTPVTASYVYLGSATGFSRRTELPTQGASAVTVADLDEDGWLDVVFANYSDGTSTRVSSTVYFGDAAGFDAARRVDLPTAGAIDVCVADFDRDGHLDLLFTDFYDTAVPTHATPSQIYWGTAAGPSADPAGHTDLPTTGAYGCAVADLDNDSQLDVVIAQHTADGDPPTPSVVYYGRGGRPDPTRSEPLATTHGALPSIADVDGNGYLDVLVGNVFGTGGAHATNSNVFFRTAGGFGAVVGYPTLGAFGTAALDWTGDGRIDVLFSSYQDDAAVFRQAARMYRSRPIEAPSSAVFDAFPTLGGWGAMNNDLGNTYDRSFVERFESRVFDLGAPPREVFLDWAVMVPTGTALTMQVRTAETLGAIDGAVWYGPRGSESSFDAGPVRIPGAQQFVQYRAAFAAPNAISSPVLDRVTLTWH